MPFALPSPSPPGSKTPRRILVGLTLPIGDTVFAQPALAAVRRRFPQAHITALVLPQFAPLARHIPAIDATIIYHGWPGMTAVGGALPTMWDIWRGQFDLFIGFSPGSNAFAFFSGIRHQVWQRLPPLSLLWGSALAPDYRETHAVDLYWRTLRPLGLVPRTRSDLIPCWEVSAAERARAHALLAEAGLVPDAAPLVVVHPGAAGFGGAKRWPPERFGAVAHHLIAEAQAQVVVLGGRQDGEAAATIVAATGGRAHSFAGALDLPTSIAVIALADCYIGCDSGLTHMAVALGVPTVALYGPSSVAQFGARGRDPRKVRILTPDPYLAPIGFFVGARSAVFPPRHPRTDHMLHISVARVLAAARSLLPHPLPVPTPE